MGEPVLSAICLLGSRRERLPRLISAVASQTAAEQIELVLVDGGGDGMEPPPSDLRRQLVPWPSELSFGEARAVGVRQARGEIVAFLLDHCYPEPGWAEALIAAYREQPWAAVGYGFRNANPRGYASRATFLAHYGPWEGAPPGETALLPGTHVSYRRRELLNLGPGLGELLEIDSSVHRRLLRAGLDLALEPRAVAEAECFERVIDTCRANEVYGRQLAVRRAQSEGWSTGRRLLNGFAAPLAATVFRLARVWRASPNRRGELLRCLPAITAICLAGAFGESRGYLFGGGGADRELVHWELEATRAGG